MAEQPSGNKYTTDSRGEPTPMPRVLRPANPNPPLPGARTNNTSILTTPQGLDAPVKPPQVQPPAPVAPGFYIVPRSMPLSELQRRLFDSPSSDVLAKYLALNPGLGDTVKAGSLIVLSDPANHACTYEEAQLMLAAEQVKIALEPLTPDEADFMVRHQAEIAGFTGQASTWLGIGTATMGKHLDKLRETLHDMERLHQDSYRQHGHLKSPEFFARRQQLLRQLDAQLLNSTRLRGYTTLSDHPKLKTALGLSSRSLVHQWDKAGGPGQIPGYVAHVKSVSRAAKYMQMGGYVGIALGGVSSVLKVQEVCQGGSDNQSCRKVMFTETGKFVGSTAGGILGTETAMAGSRFICAALGASTAIGGVLCVATLVGVGASLGTDSGDVIGERIGEIIYERAQPW
ncbi:hypothetical protein SAMN05660489_02642 [Pseudomonas sp. LAMO17WK12:I10]|uniref:hypothetical protein n=1 Tax=unclassified Pseudomonas TaxID=196821 RepID=UPI000BC50388|nr:MULTISPECIES: hypothetical protein [unclassified Pseudomonas]PXX70559.1 hypothetical protein H160_02861 [Pseudomonas sp. LAMO17WK12:I9]SNY31113.1 hypothetical protein SAMN05660489_02642 [Pseudomonas sp. LAMO17WK12:I10]